MFCSALLLLFSCGAYLIYIAQTQVGFNGTYLTEGQFPWAVRIDNGNGQYIGALINANYVLTLGSYPDWSSTIKTTKVGPGTWLHVTPTPWISVDKVYVHPCAKREKFSLNTYNVALLQLNKSFVIYSKLIVIELPLGPENSVPDLIATLKRWEGDEATVVGRMVINSSTIKYMAAAVEVVSVEYNRMKYAKELKLARKPGRAVDEWLLQTSGLRVSNCYGFDSGLLVVQNVLIGLVPDWLPCGKSDYPLQYVRVDLNRLWIDEMMQTGEQFPERGDASCERGTLDLDEEPATRGTINSLFDYTTIGTTSGSSGLGPLCLLCALI